MLAPSHRLEGLMSLLLPLLYLFRLHILLLFGYFIYTFLCLGSSLLHLYMSPAYLRLRRLYLILSSSSFISFIQFSPHLFHLYISLSSDPPLLNLCFPLLFSSSFTTHVHFSSIPLLLTFRHIFFLSLHLLSQSPPSRLPLSPVLHFSPYLASHTLFLSLFFTCTLYLNLLPQFMHSFPLTCLHLHSTLHTSPSLPCLPNDHCLKGIRICLHFPLVTFSIRLAPPTHLNSLESITLHFQIPQASSLNKIHIFTLKSSPFLSLSTRRCTLPHTHTLIHEFYIHYRNFSLQFTCVI